MMTINLLRLNMLEIVFATRLKKKLLEFLKDVEHGNSYLVIRKGRPSGVLLNIDEYERLTETVRFLKDRKFLKKLLREDEKDRTSGR